ncbi:MAG: hypothetical protein KAI17_12315 [Thiotrichaceae bacterium]|nr:hypothetical protein [Thiotrichaceae bacterium]
MSNVNVPVQSLKTLIISMICAVFLAFFILLAFIGPAEYGIDPTGLGKALGLTKLAKPAQQQKTKAVVSCPTGEQLASWQDIVLITVPAKSGLEYKFYLKQDAEIAYQWTTDGTSLYFDFHGEPAGDKTGYFKSYRETTNRQSEGVLTVPFTGTHGWYWKNDSNNAVRITLKTKGQYKIKGLI